MGFPGHCKIAGHSGTDFKHRKAFSKLKEYKQNTSKKYGNITTEEFLLPIPAAIPTDYFGAYQRNRRINLLVKLPAFLISICFFGFFLRHFSNTCTEHSIVNFNEARLEIDKEKELKKMENITYFYHSGNYHLQKNELHKAREYFTRTLAADEDNLDARIGLTETLTMYCHRHNLFCKEARIQLEFLQEMDYLTYDGIWNLEKQINRKN